MVFYFREKDVLWQKIYFLDHERQLRLSDKWMDDSEVDKCLNCSAQFSLVLRKVMFFTVHLQKLCDNNIFRNTAVFLYLGTEIFHPFWWLRLMSLDTVKHTLCTA